MSNKRLIAAKLVAAIKQRSPWDSLNQSDAVVGAAVERTERRVRTGYVRFGESDKLQLVANSDHHDKLELIELPADLLLSALDHSLRVPTIFTDEAKTSRSS